MRRPAHAAILVCVRLLLAPSGGADLFPETAAPDFAETGDFEPEVPAPSERRVHRAGARPARHQQILPW
jgi:hypothetical protein